MNKRWTIGRLCVTAVLSCWTCTAFADYAVTVVTGDVDGAGTDADVWITLYGASGTSAEKFLDNPGVNDFERNNWDEFTVPGSFGQINSLRIRHNNANSRPGWYLQLVRVQNSATGTEDVFVANRWLAKDENDKRIDITISRTPNAKTKVLTGPYREAYQWTKAPGVSSAWTRAFKNSGWINFYADAFIGGAAAEAGHCAGFYTNGNVPIAVKATITYVGGPINFGIASFSELQSRINLNGSVAANDLKAAFTGSIIKDKIKKVIALTDDSPDLSAPFEEFTQKMNEGKTYTKLASSFQTLKQSNEAKSIHMTKSGTSRGGLNTVYATLRTNAASVLTGSSIIIVGGFLEKVEVIGIVQ